MEIYRIVDRLIDAERREPNRHWQYDYRQARICVALAGRGSAIPFIESSYRIHGCHPDDVFPYWLAEQKLRLGREFHLWYSEDGVLRPDVIIPDYDPYAS